MSVTIKLKPYLTHVKPFYFSITSVGSKSPTHDLLNGPIISYHGSEVCEFMGSFILNELTDDK